MSGRREGCNAIAWTLRMHVPTSYASTVAENTRFRYVDEMSTPGLYISAIGFCVIMLTS